MTGLHFTSEPRELECLESLFHARLSPKDIADHPLVQILLDQSFNVTSPFIASPFVWFRGDPNLNFFKSRLHTLPRSFIFPSARAHVPHMTSAILKSSRTYLPSFSVNLHRTRPSFPSFQRHCHT